MNQERREAIIRGFLEQNCMTVLEKKGQSSSGGTENPNQGFFDVASPPQVDHYIVWWVYFMKQVVRFKTWIFTRKPPAETLTEMLTDIINYALICVSMLVEDGLIPDPTAEKTHED